MNVIVVDDERLILEAESKTVKRVLPEANVFSFKKAKEAIAFAEDNRIDIAFVDISMKVIGGLELAERLQACNPKVNIIFCISYGDDKDLLEEHDLICSAYLMKTLTDEKIEKACGNLKFPIY